MWGVFCGGQGDDPEGPREAPAAACADLTKQAPALFALLNDPQKPLDGLRSTLADLSAEQCLDASRPACTTDDDCGGGACDGAVCACRLSYSPMGEVLRAGLRGLAAAASEPPESAGARCVSRTEAAKLAQPNHLCEVKRAWAVLDAQDGLRALLADPALSRTLRAVADYASGKKDGKVHSALPGTFGRMARNRELCDPANLASLLDKLLLHVTPALATSSTQVLRDLIQDPTLRPLLLTLAAGNHQQGRESIAYLVHFFFQEVTAVKTGSEASQKLQGILEQLVYPSINNAALQAHVQAAADLLKAAIADDIGSFPALQAVIVCTADPAVDVDPVTGQSAELISGVYDLLVDPQGVSVPDGLSLLEALVKLDKDGQLFRALRGLVVAIESDEQALDGMRGAVAEALCGPAESCDGVPFAKGVLPALALLTERGAIGDLLTLIDTLLSGCKQ